MNKRWTTSNKAVFNVSYHLIWCPKYRRGVLVGDVEERLMQLLNEKGKEIGLDIEGDGDYGRPCSFVYQM